MNDLNQILGTDYTPPTALEKVAGAFRKFGHTLSMVPLLSGAAFVPAGIAAILDSTDGFFSKGFGSGTKKLVEGTVDTAVTGLTGASGVGWWLVPANWVAGLATKNSIGELARQGTKGITDALLPDSFSGTKTQTQLARDAQVLGPSPVTTGFAPAAIGHAYGLPQPQMTMHTHPQAQPNQWRQMEAQRRGQSLEQADQAFIRAGHEEANALRNATQTPQQLGAS